MSQAPGPRAIQQQPPAHDGHSLCTSCHPRGRRQPSWRSRAGDRRGRRPDRQPKLPDRTSLAASLPAGERLEFALRSGGWRPGESARRGRRIRGTRETAMDGCDAGRVSYALDWSAQGRRSRGGAGALGPVFRRIGSPGPYAAPRRSSCRRRRGGRRLECDSLPLSRRSRRAISSTGRPRQPLAPPGDHRRAEGRRSAASRDPGKARRRQDARRSRAGRGRYRGKPRGTGRRPGAESRVCRAARRRIPAPA